MWFALLDSLPIPWMLGPIFSLSLSSFGCSVLKLASSFKHLPSWSLRYAIMIVGVFIGAKFDAAMLTRLGFIFPLILLLALSLVITIPLCYYFLRLCRFNKTDALASALPGAFTLIIIQLTQQNLPLKRVTIVQTLRIFYATGLVSAAPPPPVGLFNFVLFVVAVAIASQLAGLELRGLLSDGIRGSAMTILMLAIAASLAGLLSRFSDYSFLAGFLALIPGGIHEVSLIAIIYNLDPVMIAFIHWLRVVCIGMGFPFLLKWLRQT